MTSPESVWGYPRPPRVEAGARPARVVHEGRVLASSAAPLRVLETSHPPAIYIPRPDVDINALEPSSSRTVCEFKGVATYWSLREESGRLVRDVAWSYESPASGYEQITRYLSFYPSRVDACYLGDERVEPQEGGFYGGWITADITGPFKGGAGTAGW